MELLGFILDYLAVAGVYALLAVSMNIEYGWAGIPNFGKAAFIAAGGAAAAIVAAQLGPPLLLGVPGTVPGSLEFYGEYARLLGIYQQNPLATWLVLLLSSLLGGLVALVLGVAFTFPAVRLREDYLAIALLMAAQLVWIILRTVKPIMGGTMSMVLPSPDFKSLAAALSGGEPSPQLVTAVKDIFIWGLVGLYLLAAERLLNTPFGRKLRAVRDDEIAAEALGKDVALARLEAMMAGSFLAGVAGAVYALVHLSSVNPDNYMPDMTFMILAMVLVGGVGNNLGAVVGGALLALVDRIGYTIGSHIASEMGMLWGGYLSYMVYGLAILLAIALRPQGLLPEGRVRTPAWRIYQRVLGPVPKPRPTLRLKLVLPRVRRRGKEPTRG